MGHGRPRILLTVVFYKVFFCSVFYVFSIAALEQHGKGRSFECLSAWAMGGW